MMLSTNVCVCVGGGGEEKWEMGRGEPKNIYKWPQFVEA